MDKYSGIYSIINIENGKQYIGSSINVFKRKKQHFYDLRKNKHSNSHLQHAYNLYGEGSFEYSTILVCEKEELQKYEDAIIKILKAEYNIRPASNSNYGIKHTEESRKNMSIAHLGQHNSPESYKKVSDALKGKPRPEEVRKKISLSSKGKIISKPRKGWHHTKEAIEKMSKSHLGKKMSDETKKKISEACSLRKREVCINDNKY